MIFTGRVSQEARLQTLDLIMSAFIIDPNWTRDELVAARSELLKTTDELQTEITTLKAEIESARGRRYATGEFIDAARWGLLNNEARAKGLRHQKLLNSLGEVTRRIRQIDSEATRRADFVILIEAVKQHVPPDLFEAIWADFAARKNARA
jgi:hypothetical protein